MLFWSPQFRMRTAPAAANIFNGQHWRLETVGSIFPAFFCANSVRVVGAGRGGLNLTACSGSVGRSVGKAPVRVTERAGTWQHRVPRVVAWPRRRGRRRRANSDAPARRRGHDAQCQPHKASCVGEIRLSHPCLLYTSPSPRDRQKSRMPSSA